MDVVAIANSVQLDQLYPVPRADSVVVRSGQVVDGPEGLVVAPGLAVRLVPDLSSWHGHSAVEVVALGAWHTPGDTAFQTSSGTLVELQRRGLQLTSPNSPYEAASLHSLFLREEIDNLIVDWGDGSEPDEYSELGDMDHEYAASGTYEITVTVHFVDDSDALYLRPTIATFSHVV